MLVANGTDNDNNYDDEDIVMLILTFQTRRRLYYFKINELASNTILHLHKSMRKRKTKHSNRLTDYPFPPLF